MPARALITMLVVRFACAKMKMVQFMRGIGAFSACSNCRRGLFLTGRRSARYAPVPAKALVANNVGAATVASKVSMIGDPSVTVCVTITDHP